MGRKVARHGQHFGLPYQNLFALTLNQKLILLILFEDFEFRQNLEQTGLQKISTF